MKSNARESRRERRESFSTSLSVTIGQAICYLMANLRYGGATRHAGGCCWLLCSLSVHPKTKFFLGFLIFLIFCLLDTHLIATWDCPCDIPTGFSQLFFFSFSFIIFILSLEATWRGSCFSSLLIHNQNLKLWFHLIVGQSSQWHCYVMLCQALQEWWPMTFKAISDERVLAAAVQYSDTCRQKKNKLIEIMKEYIIHKRVDKKKRRKKKMRLHSKTSRRGLLVVGRVVF